MDNKETVDVTCQGCGSTETVPRCCSYTGMRHGEGWTYKCMTCGGEMMEKRKKTDDLG